MSEDHEYNEAEDDAIVTAAKSSGTADEALMSMLRDLRKKVAKKLGVPPFVVFQDPSLEDMALKYPITIDELSNVHGVGEGKAKKYGKEFRRNPVGTGPFMFNQWEEGVAFTMLKNPTYFQKDSTGKRLPYLDAVKVSFLDSKAAEFLNFQHTLQDIPLQDSPKDQWYDATNILQAHVARDDH